MQGIMGSCQRYGLYVFAFVVCLFLGGNASAALAQDALVKEPNHVYICTFNVYKLGDVDDKYKDNDENAPIPERIHNLAEVVAVGAFDLVVLEEVTEGKAGDMAMSDLADVLANEHDLDYLYFLSDYIGRGLMREAIGFLYDPDVLTLETISGTTWDVDNIEIPGRDLVRTQWRAGDFDFTLIACHLAWGNEADRDAGYAKIDDIFHTPVPSEFSHDPDIIVLGDFNRFGADMDSVLNLTFDPTDSTEFLAPNVTFFDPKFSKIKQVTSGSIAGKGVPSDDPQLVSTTVANNRFVYDMILLSSDVAEEFPPGATQATYGVDFGIIHFDEADGFGFQSGADDLFHNDLKEAYSDHRPLFMRFKTNAGKLDGGGSSTSTGGIALAEHFAGLPNRDKYHRPNCWTIDHRTDHVKWTSRAAAEANSRDPCGSCKP